MAAERGARRSGALSCARSGVPDGAAWRGVLQVGVVGALFVAGVLLHSGQAGARRSPPCPGHTTASAGAHGLGVAREAGAIGADDV